MKRKKEIITIILVGIFFLLFFFIKKNFFLITPNEQKVIFRTNANNNFGTPAAYWVAYDWDGDGKLDPMGYKTELYGCPPAGWGFTTKLGFTTPEGTGGFYEIWKSQNSKEIGICKSINNFIVYSWGYGYYSKANLNLTPTEPYKTNKQEVYAVMIPQPQKPSQSFSFENIINKIKNFLEEIIGGD